LKIKFYPNFKEKKITLYFYTIMLIMCFINYVNIISSFSHEYDIVSNDRETIFLNLESKQINLEDYKEKLFKFKKL